MTKLQMFLNNLKAQISRNLAAAGFGGGTINVYTELEALHIRNGMVMGKRKVLDKVVTNAFVADLVDVLQGKAGPLGTIGDYKYHASGTGTASEAASDTSLGAEVGSRVVGTQEEGATANIYKSVATISYSGSYAITEHGLFNASSGGTLMDRTTFPAINVVSGDSIQFSFQITFSSGG